MKPSGEIWALGAVAALAAGAAWSGRRGGRNLDLARQRQIWNWLLAEDVPVLNEAQVKALWEGRFVFPDGTEAAEGKVLVLRSEEHEARAVPETTPTIRGREKVTGVTVEISKSNHDLYNEHRPKLLLLIGEEADEYFLFPEDVKTRWTQ